VEGEGTARGIEVGALVKIDDLDAPADKLLIITTHHEIRNPDQQSAGADAATARSATWRSRRSAASASSAPRGSTSGPW